MFYVSVCTRSCWRQRSLTNLPWSCMKTWVLLGTSDSSDIISMVWTLCGSNCGYAKLRPCQSVSFFSTLTVKNTVLTGHNHSRPSLLVKQSTILDVSLWEPGNTTEKKMLKHHKCSGWSPQKIIWYESKQSWISEEQKGIDLADSNKIKLKKGSDTSHFVFVWVEASNKVCFFPIMFILIQWFEQRLQGFLCSVVCLIALRICCEQCVLVMCLLVKLTWFLHERESFNLHWAIGVISPDALVVSGII